MAVERGARDDQRRAVEAVGQQTPSSIASVLHFWQFRPLADALLQENWDRVVSLGTALADRMRLSGDEAAELAGLPNPPGPPTDPA
ncbi:hypothetical protein [Kitasatospora sp. NPDC059327]|uniref:hypothetical protein n=1 Tax=Kitasatospora sp. NPDC059327 TaxID=3346803 RepID=UPI00369BA8B1